MKMKIIIMLCILVGLATAQKEKEKTSEGGMAMPEMQMHDSTKHGHSKMKMDAKKDSMTQIMYTCSMHPEVKETKPGKCPKCGMELVAMNSENNSKMKEKFKLMKDGKYECCIDEACDMCIKHGGCNCKDAVLKGTPVCGECYDGWVKGKGDVKGKTIKDVKKWEWHKN